MRLPAPLAERLAKIRVRFRNLPFGRHVQEPGHADGGIANKPVGFIAGPAPLSLEQIVDQPSGISEVLAKISDAGADRFHDDKPINPAGRLDDVGHQPLVEGPHHPIERFDGVGDGFGENNGLRGRRHREAGGWLLARGRTARGTTTKPPGRPSNSPVRLVFQAACLPGIEVKRQQSFAAISI